MQRRSSFMQVILGVGTASAFLLGAFFYFWDSISNEIEYLKNALFTAGLVTVALVSVLVYQAFRIRESAQTLAENMTHDMLVSSHELFFEVYRDSPVPYVIIDEKGTIESTNIATARLFNVEVGAMDSLNIFDFVTGSDARQVALIPEYFKQGRSVHDAEVSIQRPDGVVHWVMLSLFSFTDADRAHKGLLTLVDVTKQKMIDKAKTEFVSLASHQLRTPISSMKWNIELLETAGKGTFNTLQTSYIEKITHALERMDSLVKDFLSASKLELGTLVAQRAVVELAPFLKGIYEEHRITAEQKQVRIESNWDTVEGSIISDANLLHMIVSNIFGNAVKYTMQGGAVRAQVDVGASEITVRVTDTGIGIPEEDQEMIFSKLFRAGNARTEVTEGTGLGLYIVKEAVRVLGGRIKFESKMGVGTTFIVTLPK